MPSSSVALTQDSLLGLAWRLPHEARRVAFRRLRPDMYRDLQGIRTGDGTDPGLAEFDRRRCIFIHVPKCAGVSVSRSLFGDMVATHLAVKSFQLIYSKQEFESYFKFTFVRNPWDRLFSAFRFLKRGGMTDKDRAWANTQLAPYDTFDDFVRRWVTAKNVASWQHFKPQHRFLLDPAGRLQIDYVGRFETLEQDFCHIAERLGIERTIAHHNRTDGPSATDYRSFYTDETRRIVADVYRRDIELFDYRFDPPDG